jgi:hypothetical protein
MRLGMMSRVDLQARRLVRPDIRPNRSFEHHQIATTPARNSAMSVAVITVTPPAITASV